ncbi:hypothetical protein Dsin_024450 [Dipteronia sinensis]|uniref:Uncharacterized protein n=1 Tax=Dipteronia sinensis TaxID=43782 RepID=A0AAE0DVX5_9ROSI|nr:hypothetical protein Dsin_024450 [Dipteronia sinensis]
MDWVLNQLEAEKKRDMKKMNRLDVNRLNNLVYVKFNSKLMNKHKRLRDKEKKVEVLEVSDTSNAQEWFADEGDEEVDPGSEEYNDTDEEIDVQFESDEERACYPWRRRQRLRNSDSFFIFYFIIYILNVVNLLMSVRP